MTSFMSQLDEALVSRVRTVQENIRELEKVMKVCKSAYLSYPQNSNNKALKL